MPYIFHIIHYFSMANISLRIILHVWHLKKKKNLTEPMNPIERKWDDALSKKWCEVLISTAKVFQKGQIWESMHDS